MLTAGVCAVLGYGLLVVAASAGGGGVLPRGVRAVWDLDLAYQQKTATRHRVSINGLWQWQPASTDATAVPAGRWGYFKVPGCWPGITSYMQKDCQRVFAHPSWQGVSLAMVRAAWYQREITVPPRWAGRRIVLRVEYLNSLAVVYLDGKQVGRLLFPGGQLDLTAHCRPGSRHMLSMLVVALPLKGVLLSYSDTASAREVEGRVARRGLCGDVYLESMPSGPRIGDVRVETSVRRWQIRFDTGLDDVRHGDQYVLRAAVCDGGREVRRFTSQPFGLSQLRDGRFAFGSSWRPEKLWDIHTPENQYELHLQLLDRQGKVLDEAFPVRFGFREFWIDGRDFFLNGSRIFLSAVPLDNAQVGAAWATYEAARESLLRLKSFGINFVYTHNYGCQPGDHLSFEEVLRAADDVGMLVAFSQPHFGHYDWEAEDAERTNGYARHAAFYVRVAQNHPSVVAYATSHNATGYAEDMNPDQIDGRQARRSPWSARNARRALQAEAIIRRLDPSRIVYHHSSGNLSSMFTVNFYANFAPPQELSDWFEHWATAGIKPLFTCEYMVPMPWDWTMYRGWYRGHREFGSARVPWEFCLAEWNAQFLGDQAYRISEQEKENLRWEAEQFRAGRLWHRWDYPHPVGSSDFLQRYPVYALYFRQNWPAFRTWGVSAISPWNHGHYWVLRDGVDRSRRELPVDWERLQRPGFSPDYIDQRYERMDLAYERSDWIATVAAEALMRYNGPLLGYIAGKPGALTSRDHNFLAGETVEKQLIVINNSRETVRCDCHWTLELGHQGAISGSKQVTVPTGQQQRIPLRLALPEQLEPGRYELSAAFRFSTGQTQRDVFPVDVLPRPARLRSAAGRIALFDPVGQTAAVLDGMGVPYTRIEAHSPLAGYDLLIVGKGALTVGGPAPDVSGVPDGLKVLIMEQTPEVLEQRFGFRVATYGMRWVFPRVPDHPLLAGLRPRHLRDWRGASTIVPPRLEYLRSPKFNYLPTVRWCGLLVSRLWRCGNRGNVATVLIEKPACGDFLPVVDAGYSLQFTPLMEYRQGHGVVLFCQMDVTGRTESDPAAETLVRNMIEYLMGWKPLVRRQAVYAGSPAGRRHLMAAGFDPKPLPRKLTGQHVLVVGRGGSKELAQRRSEIAEWLESGGHMLLLGLDENEANAILPRKVHMRQTEHIATWFPPFGVDSLLAGISPAEVHNPAPKQLPLLTAGATIYGNGVLGRTDWANVVFCQLPPYEVTKAQGAVPSLVVDSQEAASGRHSALVTMGTAPWAQFGQRVAGGQPGRTYTFAAVVKAVDEPVPLRLEVERAASPWDRAVRGDEQLVGTDRWTELHVSFRVERPYQEGWSAYIHCGQEGARFRADRFRLYEGPYVPAQSADRDTASAGEEPNNLFANADFEKGSEPWFFSYRTEQRNLKRTFRRTSYMLARLLANMGASASTPVLERFATPVPQATRRSILRNASFQEDADGDGVPDQWSFSSGSKQASCRREPLGDHTSTWALHLDCPPGKYDRQPSVMIAQYDVPLREGQWYRITLKVRAQGLSGDVSMVVADRQQWGWLFDNLRLTPGPDWERFTFEVQSKATAENTRFQIWYSGPGQLWLADLRMEPIPDPSRGRWQHGLYLDTPTEWDDPYRFFRW